MSGNKRIFYACYGVGPCGGAPLPNIISAGLSLSQSYKNIFAQGSIQPSSTYGDMPDVEISYKAYLKNFVGLASEPGLNSFIGLELFVGDDDFTGWDPNSQTNSVLTGAVSASYLLLSEVTYTLSIDKPFTVERKYKGFSKDLGKGSGSTPYVSSTNAMDNVLMRHTYLGNLPSELSGNAPQNISISFSINRDYVQEFATRKPYASYINFPIESSVTFDLLAQSMDSIVISAMESACQNPVSYKQNININLCQGGSLAINNARLTSLNYSGADSDGNSNLTLSATYTGYGSPDNIKPVIILDEHEDPCA